MRTIRLTAVLALAFCAGAPAWAQPAPAGRAIFTCTDAAGKKQTSDRLIAECVGREQRVLNADGSLNRIVPPTLTADERAQVDAREREATAAREAAREAMRRDRNLMSRFPNEAAHRKARDAALDNVQKSLRLSEARLVTLAKERKPLLTEAEFYAGKRVPANLKAQLEANDASAEAQRSLVQNLQIEAARIDKTFDVELDRLRQLWAGAPAGSPGTAPVAVSKAASAPRK
jgi:hypothetical protein